MEMKRWMCRVDLNRFMISSPRWLIRILGAIVKSLVLPMFESHPHFPARSAVRAELVGDHNPGRASLLADELAQQSFGCLLVATALHQGVKDETILIDGTPKPMLCSIDGHDDFIDMPICRRIVVRAAGCDWRIPDRISPPSVGSFRG